MRDNYADKLVQKVEKTKITSSKLISPFERAQTKLKSLYEQKSKLSYNPYKVKRSFLNSNNDTKLCSFIM